MSAVTYTATKGLKLLGSEVGAWLTEITAGDVFGSGVSVDLSATGIDLDTIGTAAITKSEVATDAELMGWGTTWTSLKFLDRVYGSELDYQFNEAFTIMAWVQPGNIPAGTRAICGNLSFGTGDVGGYGLRYVLGKATFSVASAAGTLTSAADVGNFVEDEWIFLVGVHEADGTLILYKNGIVVGTAASGTNMDQTGSLFKVGMEQWNSGPADPFLGDISISKVSDGALTQTQILSIYNSEKSMFEPYSVFTEVGLTYDLDLGLSTVNRSEDVKSKTPISIGGNQETVVKRVDTMHDIVINELHKNDLPTIRSFLQSVNSGQVFTYDPYGSVAVPDNPVSVIAEGGHQEQRINDTNYFMIPMKMREL